jgi:hypothetical protein
MLREDVDVAPDRQGWRAPATLTVSRDGDERGGGRRSGLAVAK